MKKVTSIIQARMTSTRLPGKVLMSVMGKSLLEYMLERVRRAWCVESILVATTNNATDDPLVKLAEQFGAQVFRGSEFDVLDRYYRAASTAQAEHIMRLTADCPLIDPEILDQVAEFYFDGGYDYVSNALEPNLPDGLDAEVFSFSALQAAWAKAELPSHREHVTPYIRKSGLYRLGSWKQSRNFSDLRWTVDETEDFELVRSVLEALYPDNPCFGLDDVLKLLANHPEWTELNSKFERNEGVRKSLDADSEYLARQNHAGSLAR